MGDYKHFKLGCKTLSPIHIGSGENLASIGDYYTNSNRLYFIDKEKLDHFLDPVNDNDFFESYLNEIKRNVSLSRSDFSIVPFLQQHGIELNAITLENEVEILTSDYKSHKNSQLKLAIAQKNQLYFPGSTIKGAIKTALFFNYLKENKHILKQWEEIIDTNTNRPDYLEVWKIEIEKEFNQFFKNKKSDYNLLRIEDTSPFKNEDKGVWETGRFHFYHGNEEMVNWLCEGIKNETTFDLSITLVPEFKASFLQILNTSDISSLFSVINKFSKAQLELEIEEISASNLLQESKMILLGKLKKLLLHTNDNTQAILRIGAGKSFFYNTVCSLLDKPHFDKLRSLVGIGKKDEPIFPLSRTFTADYESFGWILLELPKVKEIESPINTVAEIILNETLLQAVVIDQKKVKIKLNDSIIEVQLALGADQKGLVLKKGDLLQVFVKQVSKENRIVMVGIK